MIEQHAEFVRTLNAYGVTPPEVTEAWQFWDAASKVTVVSSAENLRARVYAGQVAADDLEREILEAARLSALTAPVAAIKSELDAALQARFATAVRDHCSSIIHGLGKPFAEAAKRLTAASKLFGPDATADSVLLQGAAAAAAWNDLGTSAAVLSMLLGIRQTIGRKYGGDNGAVDPWPVTMVLDRDSVPHPFNLAEADAMFRQVGTFIGTSGSMLSEVRGGGWRRLTDAGYKLKLNGANDAFALMALGSDPANQAAVMAQAV